MANLRWLNVLCVQPPEWPNEPPMKRCRTSGEQEVFEEVTDCEQGCEDYERKRKELEPTK